MYMVKFSSPNNFIKSDASRVKLINICLSGMAKSIFKILFFSINLAEFYIFLLIKTTILLKICIASYNKN